jgi:hypothetical protein
LTEPKSSMPNPSSVTAEAIDKAISAAAGIINARIDGQEKAVDLLQAQTNRSPTIGEVYARFDERLIGVNSALKAEREISNEKFLRVDQQFIQLEKLAAQLKIAGDTAVAAALQAQKEAAGEQTKSSAAAISKSEAATGESIKQLQTLFNTSIGGLSKEIADLKSRMDRGEGQGVIRNGAIDESRYTVGENRSNNADSRANLALIVSALGVLVLFVLHFIK